jgi:PPP family 3-phenylpropionic acid transporter
MRNYILLTAVGAIAYIAIGINSPLISLYLQSLGAGYAQISFIQTSTVITMLAGSYTWGYLSDRLGRRKPLLVIGLAGTGVAYLIISQAPSWSAAWLTRILEGAFMSAYGTLSLAMIGDVLDVRAQASASASNHKGRYMGIYRGIGSLAFAVGATAGGQIADRLELSSAFLVCGVLYLAAALVACTVAETVVQYQVSEERSPAQPQPAAVAGGLPAFFLAGVFLWTAAHSASASMWPNYMATLGYTKSTIGGLWGLAAALEMFFMYVAGILSDLFGRSLLLTVGALGISLVNLGYLTVATFLPALLVVQVIRGLGFGAYTATAMTFAAEYGPARKRGSRSGIYSTTGSAGQLLGIFVSGMTVQFFGFSALFALCSLLAFGAAICFWLLRLHMPQPTRLIRSVTT